MHLITSLVKGLGMTLTMMLCKHGVFAIRYFIYVGVIKFFKNLWLL